jgi:peptidoglycan hydrolase-like protein with peptidoglycan-binding domain
MTPHRARAYAWLFIALAGCASANVMLLQQRLPLRGMGGAYGESAAGGSIARTYTSTPVAKATKAAAAPNTSGETNLVQAIQRELKATGAYSGPGDGRPSRALTAAIMAYEFQQGLAVAGEASDAVLSRLILGATLSPARGYAPGEIIPGSPADQLVRWVIDSLNRLGHDAGKPQSRLDLKAMQAIRAFEMAQKMTPTGRVNEALVRQLERRKN